MRAAWVRPGGPLFPDQAKAKRVGLEQFFWDATDPTIDPDYVDPQTNMKPHVLAEMRKAGWKVGTTRDPGWTGTSDPKAFAALLSGDITKFAGSGIQHSVIADMEMHDPAYVLAVLKEFRRLRPGRYIYWTLEPLQAGSISGGNWISPELASQVGNDAMTWVVPQAYRGGMQPVSERACCDDLHSLGISSSKILSYYGRYEEAFNGIVFDWATVAA